MLKLARSFFEERGYLEADPCALMRGAPLDSHVEPIPVAVTPTETGYLHTSPEFALKRLLAAGCGNVYFLGHVFRQGEIGARHNPEFCMAEWYRVGADYHDFIAETAAFLSLFLGPLPLQFLSYRDAFARYATGDISAIGGNPSWSPAEQLDFRLTTQIEPHLGRNCITALTDFPPEQAALARIQNGTAERFELYVNGLELANGYHELAQSAEQHRRFTAENAARVARGKQPLPLDNHFIAALDHLPDCCGVSVGFDRLMMLQQRENHIAHVLPFSWDPGPRLEL